MEKTGFPLTRELTESRKDQIIRTSEMLFADKGFMATSMRDIASELGIEAASLYSHIISKDQILESICFRIGEQFIAAIDEINDIYFNAEEKLRRLIKMHVNILTGNIEASTVFIHEWRHLTEPKSSEFREMRRHYEEGLRSIISLGEDENVFQSVDKKFAALAILSALNWISQWYKPGGNMTPDEIAENLTNFVLTGLSKK